MNFIKFFSPRFYYQVIINVFFDILPLSLLIILNKYNQSISIIQMIFICVCLILCIYAKFKLSLLLNNSIQLFRHKYSFSTLSSFLNNAEKNELELDDSARKVLSESDFTVNSFARPLERLISSTLLIILILTVLFYQNSFITLSLFGIVVLPYLLLYAIFKIKIKFLGEKRATYNKNRFQSCLTLISLWKESKVFSFEKSIINDFETNSSKFCKTISMNYTLNNFPKFLFEIIIIFVFIFFSLCEFIDINLEHKIKSEEIPIFAFSAFKIIPSISSMFAALGMLNFGSSIPHVKFSEIKIRKSYHKPFKKIFIDKLIYNIGANMYSLENFNLNKNFIIHGNSGCGKSTFIDVLCGFKNSHQYNVLCDGIKITPDDFLIQASIAFQVPKFFSSSIKNNIIINEPFDLNKFNEIISICQLSDLDLETNIENINNSLSGGQLQRISLARSLYKTSSILFLDEPTNGLPKDVSNEIINKIMNYYGGILVIITHDPMLLTSGLPTIDFNDIKK